MSSVANRPTNIDAVLADALAPVKAQAERVRAEIEKEEATLAELREMEKQLNRVIYAADPASKPGPKQNGHRKSERPSPESVDKALEAAKSFDGEEFTLTMLGEKAGMDKTTAMRALNVLRDQSLVRFTGQHKWPGQVGGRESKWYALVPPR